MSVITHLLRDCHRPQDIAKLMDDAALTIEELTSAFRHCRDIIMFDDRDSDAKLDAILNALIPVERLTLDKRKEQ